MNFDKSNSNGRYTLRLEVTETGTDTVNNTSSVSYSLKLIANTGYHFSQYAIGYKVTLNGTVVAEQLRSAGKQYSISGNGTITFASGTYTAKHNTDGSLNMPVAFSIDMASDEYTPGPLSGSGTMALTTIPRASLIGSTDANIGSVSTITINRKASSYTHSIKYAFEGLSGYIKADGTTSSSEVKLTATSIAFQVPTSFYAKIPNAKSAQCILTCTTYSGDTVIGTDISRPRYTAAEADCAPTVSATAYDSLSSVVALTGSNKKVLKGVSVLHVDITAAGKNSATISRIDVWNGSQTNLNANTSFTFANPSDSAEVRVVVTDSRGYATTAYAPGLTMVEYYKPVLYASIQRESPTSDVVQVRASGKWFNSSLGKVANTLTVEVRYKPRSQADYSDSANPYYPLTLTKSGNDFTGSLDLSGLEYQQEYSVRVRASDKVCAYGGIAEAIYYEGTVTKGIPTAHWGENDFWVEAMLHANGGFESVLSAHRYSSDNDNSESAFETWLNGQLSDMEGLSVRDVAWTCYPAITGSTVCSRLYKHPGGSYAVLFGFDYGGSIYLKRKTAGSWQACQVVRVSSPPGKTYIEAGDTVSISAGSFSGYVTNGSKELQIIIPLSKPCFASAVSITGTVIGRGIGGYINGTTYDNSALNLAGGSGYTVSASITPAGISVYVTFTAAITGATNNTPVSVMPRTALTLTFK